MSSTALARKHRWRERQRSGRFCVTIEVPEDLADALVAVEMLPPELADDREAIARALAALVETWMAGTRSDDA